MSEPSADTASSSATAPLAPSAGAPTAIQPASAQPRLTSLAHGGGCGCKVSPALLAQILRGTARLPIPPELLVGIETADDAAVYRLNEEQALVATTDFFMPIVDDPFDFGRIAAANAISDIYAMGARPILALALVGMPVKVLSTQTIAAIMDGGACVCASAGVPVAGGHTIDSVEPIYGLVVIGLVHPRRVARNSGSRPGDRLILGKPLGVGIYSAALKKDALDAEGYAGLIDTTTHLNTAGPELAALDGVHALSDVTGFGLAGHALEFAQGASCVLQINWPHVPLLPRARELALRGFITGASARNWESYGGQVHLPAGFTLVDRALLTDPQTSGGLLVSCAPGAVASVLETFRRHGLGAAAECGAVLDTGTPTLHVLA